MISAAALLASCDHSGSLCETYSAPYPDTVTGRYRTNENAEFLDGMAANAKGDHEAAIVHLKAYLASDEHDHLARLYLATTFLEAGKPFDAELQLDLLEHEDVHTFKDQIEWYRTVCWLCSDQRERAIRAAANIASSATHTYQPDAARLMEVLRTE